VGEECKYKLLVRGRRGGREARAARFVLRAAGEVSVSCCFYYVRVLELLLVYRLNNANSNRNKSAQK